MLRISLPDPPRPPRLPGRRVRRDLPRGHAGLCAPVCSWPERSAPPAPAVLPPPTRSSAPTRPSPSGAAIPSRSTSSPARACRPRPSPASPKARGVAARRRRRRRSPSARGTLARDRAPSDCSGHGWASAALTPYRLVAGHAPSGSARRRRRLASACCALGARLHVTAPGGEGTYRVTGIARGPPTSDRGQTAVFFAGRDRRRAVRRTPARVNAVGVIAEPARADELRRGCAAVRPGSTCSTAPTRPTPTPATRRRPTAKSLIAIFGTMGGIAGFVALFVVAGTFALAIAQRRRETAVLRALGATPRQVRRLIATEALFVSLVGERARPAGRPAARQRARRRARRPRRRAGRLRRPGTPGSRWSPRSGCGVGIAQLAVVAAARRAGRVRPSEALREVAIEHARPASCSTLTGVIAARRRRRDGDAVQGRGGARRSRSSPASCSRAAPRCSAAGCSGCRPPPARCPLRLARRRPGCWRAPAWPPTAGARAALATPIVLIAMLVGTQARPAGELAGSTSSG